MTTQLNIKLSFLNGACNMCCAVSNPGWFWNGSFTQPRNKVTTERTIRVPAKPDQKSTTESTIMVQRFYVHKRTSDKQLSTERF